MLTITTASRLWTGLGAGAAALWLAGCSGYANLDRDLDEHPITNTGVAATVLMPGDPGVPMGTAVPPRGLGGAPPPPAAGSAPGPGAVQGGSHGQATGAGAPSGGGMTMIGGTSQDIERHQKVNNEPAWAKVLKLPFIVAAYPFKKVHQAVTGPPDPTVKVTGPPPQAPPSPAERQARHERDLLEHMERELAGQGAGTAAPSPAPGAAASRPSASAGDGAGIGIAAELAALRRSRAASAATPTPGAATGGGDDGEPEHAGTTDVARRPFPERPYETVDRDADGRADRWIYREGREPVGEAFDEDGDGRPDRRVRFVPGTREPAAIEEDTDGDGRVDTWTDYEDGRVARRRADSSGDGEVDTWSFYRDGQLLRHEQDTTGDGFRDRMSFYEEGRLVREEEDRDGNGRPDRVSWFDEAERITRQEADTDGDDVMDMRSYYQEGKLRRRELIE